MPHLKSMTLVCLGFHLLAGPVTAQTVQELEEARALTQQALEAREAGDGERMLELARRAHRIRPLHTDLSYLVAAALARQGEVEEALDRLESLVRSGLSYRADEAEEFAALEGVPRFDAVVLGFQENARPRGVAHELLTVDVEPDFIPEGLAHDARSGDYFVGSVRKRRIVRVRPGAAPFEFAGSDHPGLASVMGMAVDPERRHLWVCSTGMEQTEGLAAELVGRSAVYKFDIDSGQLLVTFHFPQDGRRRTIGDLAVDRYGRVFLSDGRGSGIYTIRPGGDFIETFVSPGEFASPQGIAIPPDGPWIYVADASRGVFRVHRDLRRVEALSVPEETAILGIDELAWHESGLVAVQNLTFPNRILRLRLDGRSISRAEVLASNLEVWQEPTLGEVIGDRFYFVANSQWNRFDGNRLPPVEDLARPLVQWVDLTR